ncbi:NAD-dependent epimerase/dehydratase family protein [Lachnospiraceae bacterium 38-10]
MKNQLNLNNKTILITGAAGFIGANLALRLLSRLDNSIIIGIDNLNDYYDPDLKEYRLSLIDKQAKKSSSEFVFAKGDISDRAFMEKIFLKYKPQIVVNLAAQAGVRYSITNPDAYINSNIIGFYNILECCRHSYDGISEEESLRVETYKGVEHLVYASSSSVYGGNQKVPFAETDFVDKPVSLYAATKKSNELLAYSYAKLYNIPCTGLRFFTVYGPAGRPDMFYFSATQRLIKGEKIKIFNYGDCKRDFTYIDDIVEGVQCVMEGAPERNSGKDGLPIPPYAIYNIGNNHPENLLYFIQILQEELVRAGILQKDFDFDGHKELVAMQPGDVPITFADTSALERDYNYKPGTNLRKGLRKFAEWYAEFYK